VLGVWIVGIAALISLAHCFGSNTNNNLRLPGTNSQAATDLLASRFPPQQNGSNPLVFHTQTGKVTDASEKQAIEASYKRQKLTKAGGDPRGTDPQLVTSRTRSAAPRA
jgi:hypothetical protein